MDHYLGRHQVRRKLIPLYLGITKYCHKHTHALSQAGGVTTCDKVHLFYRGTLYTKKSHFHWPVMRAGYGAVHMPNVTFYFSGWS